MIDQEAEQPTIPIPPPINSGGTVLETNSTNNYSTKQLSERIVKQLEFYFSTANLDTDRWLSREMEKTRKGWVSVRKILSFPQMVELMMGFPNSAAKTTFIEESVKCHSRVLVSAKNGRHKELQLRRKKRYRRKQAKSYGTVWIGGAENCNREMLESFLSRYAKVLKITTKDRWLFADVDNTVELLKLNGQLTTISERPITVLTKQEYRKVQKDLRETEKRLRPQLPSVNAPLPE